jgi:hypothetical protein
MAAGRWRDWLVPRVLAPVVGGVAVGATALATPLAWATAHHDLAEPLALALERALGQPPGTVHVGRARVVWPGVLVVDEVRAGGARLARAEVEVSTREAIASLAGGRRPSVRRVRLVDVSLAERASAGEVDLVRPVGAPARLVIRRVTTRLGTLTLAAHDVAVDFSIDGKMSVPARIAFTGARVERAGGGLGDLAGSARRDGDRFVLRAARPGLVVSGELASDGAPRTLRAELEALPLAGVGALASPAGVDLSRATATGTLALTAVAAEPPRFSATVDVQLADVDVHHRRIAARPLTGLGLRVRGEARADRDRLSVDDKAPLELTLRRGEGAPPLTLTLAGGATRSDPTATEVALTLALPRGKCADVLASLPPAAIPALEGLAVDGQVGGRLRLAAATDRLADLRLDVALEMGCRVLSDPPLGDTGALLAPLHARATDGAGHPRDLLLAAGAPSFHALDTLPPTVIRPFLVAEDARFFRHNGFDVEMIRRALVEDLDAGRIHRGASTISQQVVKNLILSGERTWARKLEEAVLTWRLEQLVDKRRILELYLNVVELGPGVYGITEAADRYFGKLPEELSSDEAAQLAALLPAPRRGMDDAWKTRVDQLRARLRRAPPLVLPPPAPPKPQAAAPTVARRPS